MDSVSALTEFRTQAIIVEYMIRNVDVFFNSNLASAAIAYYPDTVSTPTPPEGECVFVSVSVFLSLYVCMS